MGGWMDGWKDEESFFDCCHFQDSLRGKRLPDIFKNIGSLASIFKLINMKDENNHTCIVALL